MSEMLNYNKKKKKENEDMKENKAEENNNSTDFTVTSPIGEFTMDFKQFEIARKNTDKELNPASVNYARRLMREFLGTDDRADHRYYGYTLGALMKLHLDKEFSECELIKEFRLEGKIEIEAEYSNITLQDSRNARFLEAGIRFYQNENEKFVVICSVSNYDDSQKVTIISGTEGRGLELIEQLETSFYQTGVLKNAFFDMQFNFINRSEVVNQLIAWNDDVKKQLDKDVLEFLKAMPILRENGLPNSRGIILSGPPGIGKTMMAKSLAAQANVTTILISAEMIQAKNQIKNAFKLGRKLAPTLMIIEDIDTAGTVSRRFTDHPILGEYLQAMDGMEANDGIVILATTNHTENIDPAISDRPGRFDRIIEIPLPNNKQRLKIMENILLKMPSETIPRTTLTEISRKSEGLSGAWVREIVQSAFIEAIYQGRERLNAKDLQEGLADVLKRRGMAYQSTPNLAQVIESKNAEVYTI